MAKILSDVAIGGDLEDSEYALLKTLCGTPDYHQVVRQYP